MIKKALLFITILAMLSLSSLAINITNCAGSGLTINDSSVLTQNISSVNSCITINANNTELNCQGFSILYAAINEGGIGIIAADVQNITLRNCVVLPNGTSSGAAIQFSNVTTSNVTNNTLTALSSTAQPLLLQANTNSSAGSNSNRLVNNSLYVSHSALVGVNLTNSTNNTFIDTRINNATTWISRTPDTSNNFTNTNFSNNNGSINYGGSILFASSSTNTTINTAVLSIRGTTPFANSSAVALLNTTASITINNANSSAMLVDFQDDGTYTVCNSPDCTFVSYTGSTLAFNVGHFTTFSTSSIGGVNITLSKTENFDPLNYSNGTQLITYGITINVTNGTAFNITLQDTLPSGTTLVSTQPTNGTGLTFNLGNLTAGETFVVNVTANVTTAFPNGTLLNNTANITFQNSTSGVLTLSVTESTTILNEPVTLTMLKTDTPDPVAPGGNITYRITITNTGYVTAFNLSLLDTLPSGMTLVSTQPTNGTGLTFNLGNFTPGQSFIVNITANVSGSEANGTILTNTAVLNFTNTTGVQQSINTTANTTVSAPNVVGGLSVVVAKTDTPDPVVNGTQLFYTVTISVINGTAFNVTVNDTYPGAVTFDSASPSPTIGNNFWSLGNITNTSATINITVNVSATAFNGQVLTNSIVVNFQNSTSDNLSVSTSTTTTVNASAGGVVASNVGGGGSGGGSGSGVKAKTTEPTTPVTTPTLPEVKTTEKEPEPKPAPTTETRRPFPLAQYVPQFIKEDSNKTIIATIALVVLLGAFFAYTYRKKLF